MGLIATMPVACRLPKGRHIPGKWNSMEMREYFQLLRVTLIPTWWLGSTASRLHTNIYRPLPAPAAHACDRLVGQLQPGGNQRGKDPHGRHKCQTGCWCALVILRGIRPEVGLIVSSPWRNVNAGVREVAWKASSTCPDWQSNVSVFW